jgi:5-methylcytosine-specific restriction protein B
MRATWVGDAVYAAGQQFATECLRVDGSLFTPGARIWQSSVIDDFYGRFVVNANLGTGSFMEKLEAQLEGASDETIQLAAEALFFNYLCEDDTGPEHKRKIVETVLGLMNEPALVPPELQATYPNGIARIGLAKTQKWQQIAFLLEFARAWKDLEPDRRDALLGDAAAFGGFVHQVPKHSASVQIEGLLHLVFPDEFEPVVSPNAKRRIVEAFADYLDGTEADVDAQLASIRSYLSEDYGEGFSFYDEPVTALWGGGKSPVGPTGAWLVRGANAYGSNIIPRWLEEGFVSIAHDDEGEIEPSATLPEIIEALSRHTGQPVANLRNGAVSTLRFLSKMSLDDLVLTIDPDDLVYIGRVTGDPEWVTGDTAGTARRRSVTWLNVDSPASRGDLTEAVRRLLRQNTVIDLSAVADDIAALVQEDDGGSRARGDERIANEDRDLRVEIAPVSPSLADELLLDMPWLQEIVDLLNEKRQVVFYGPPGTGKTYVAQALAKHAVGGQQYDLVQFHPAYSYEDFFEGFRPKLDAGGIEFELRPGPLRRLADQARLAPEHPHVLVIDEINRGNIAKIFGELYFLLEYRDRSMTVQYGNEQFSLPDNLFVIGTMNTADRSIALVDSALRRRFYFVGFLPSEEPLRSLLGKWLEREGHPEDAAEYLQALNEALTRVDANDETSIGPSYFITRDGPPDLDRIWRHAIAPLLEERFYGARSADEIRQEFAPEALVLDSEDYA